MTFLTTDRLIIRNVEPRDAQTMFDYRNNEICARYQRGQTKDLEGIKTLVLKRASDTLSDTAPALLAVEHKQSGDMIGEIVVMPSEETFSLGYTFLYRHHRNGYAYEALSSLISTLHMSFADFEFISFTETENTASIRLLEKLGYEYLGYVPSLNSKAFGKWIKPETYDEFAKLKGDS